MRNFNEALEAQNGRKKCEVYAEAHEEQFSLIYTLSTSIKRKELVPRIVMDGVSDFFRLTF